MPPRRRNLSADIRSLDTLGFRPSEIARRLGCSASNVTQVLRNASNPKMSDARPARYQRKASPATCQRPDARKNFETCGEPKMKTRCGETLGVCAYHYKTTKPLGGTKL